jgi:hypothetical protein
MSFRRISRIRLTSYKVKRRDLKKYLPNQLQLAFHSDAFTSPMNLFQANFSLVLGVLTVQKQDVFWEGQIIPFAHWRQGKV